MRGGGGRDPRGPRGSRPGSECRSEQRFVSPPRNLGSGSAVVVGSLPLSAPLPHLAADPSPPHAALSPRARPSGLSGPCAADSTAQTALRKYAPLPPSPLPTPRKDESEGSSNEISRSFFLSILVGLNSL